MSKKSDNRRDFLKKSVAVSTAASMPYFFSQPKTLASETRSKLDKIPIGLIGAGGMGNGNMRAASEWVEVVAIADADKSRQDSSNKNLSGGKADVYDDYEKILERDDIKVVHIATPDHWHTKPVIEAMLAGKDVYCEKPLTLTIDEGKLIRKTQKETGRIVQVGTQQRSTFNPGLFTKKCFEEEPIAYGPVFRKVKRTIIRMGHDTQWVKLRITSSSQNSIAASKSKAAINV